MSVVTGWTGSETGPMRLSEAEAALPDWEVGLYPQPDGAWLWAAVHRWTAERVTAPDGKELVDACWPWQAVPECPPGQPPGSAGSRWPAACPTCAAGFPAAFGWRDYWGGFCLACGADVEPAGDGQ